MVVTFLDFSMKMHSLLPRGCYVCECDGCYCPVDSNSYQIINRYISSNSENKNIENDKQEYLYIFIHKK
jgi:hypothetical protein